jgi:hypothetical protein
MVTIGGRELIQSFSLLIPKGEDAWLEFEAGSWKIRLRVLFEYDTTNPHARFNLIGKVDHAELSVINWNNALPYAIDTPAILGDNAGRKVVFLFTGYAVGGLKRFDLSFFWEKKNDQ